MAPRQPGGVPSASRLQRSVARAVRALGLAVAEEAILDQAGGYSVDLLLLRRGVAVEVDGPQHFCSSPRGWVPDGGSVLPGRRFGARLGWAIHCSARLWLWL